ncbi:MAG TPA: TonB-dependent receptor [Rudaea sp.]|jgi:outer membrane receptor protein involved in Fe transport|uniref:TonB-dependent receptor n=1 Tax=Rudaea sp. TaxID=2136325 RepID=UPI002F936B06
MKKHLPLRKKLLASLVTAAVVSLVAAPAVSWAQSSDAALRGKAPPEMQITAKNTATGAVRHTNSAADGSYSLVGLPPGTYQVDAGPGTEKTVTLTVASTATLDFQAAAAAAAAPAGAATLEGISVTATTLTEVKTSEIGTNISLHQIQTVPQLTRNFLEFADTVPGMVFTVDSSGNTSLRGGAMNNSSTNVYIDGVGQKSYVKEGGVSGQIGTQGNPFPQLAIGEYKVITSNYKAEYDQISSAAVTAETKSGTNDFHGEVFGSYTGDAYRDDTPAEKASGNKAKSHEKEYGFALGGPIIQDAMHFFFSYEAKGFNQPVDITSGVPVATALLPADVQKQIGPTNLPFTEDLYFAKIDWEFSDRDRVEASAKYRKENQDGGYGGSTAQSAGYATKNNDTRIDVRWQHSADLWYNELLLTHEKAFNAPVAFSGGNGQVYTFGPNNDATILAAGAASPLATQNKGQKGPGIQDDLTFSNLNWMGDHTIKMGVKYKEVTLSAQDTGDASAQFFYNVAPGGTATQPYKVFFAAPTAIPGLSPLITSKDKQFGAYLQDDWVVNDHLTLNLGVRWDIEHNPSYLDFVTPPSVIAALNKPNPDSTAPAGQTYAQALALGGVNINDYISNGHNRKAYDGEWQPRLGFSYDLNGDEEHVIIGGVGRAYDRDLYDYLQLEQTKIAAPQFTYYFQGAGGACKGSPCIAFDPKYMNGVANLQALTAATGGGEVDIMNNNLKAPYSDQFSLGMRNKVGDWNTSATITHLEYNNGFAFTLGNRYPDGHFFLNGGQPWGNGVPGFGALIIGNNGIKNRNNQLLLSADKPYTKDSGWGVTLAYTYTDAKQNRDINEHYSFDRAFVTDYPTITSNAAAKHRFVATGTIDGPWGITYSGKLILATVTPYDGFYFPPGPFAPGVPSNIPVAAIPRGDSFIAGGKIFGYREIDFSGIKHFDLTRGIDFYLRMDVLNVMNYKNFDPGNGATSIPNNTLPIEAVINRHGNIVGVPRTFKFTMGLKF